MIYKTDYHLHTNYSDGKAEASRLPDPMQIPVMMTQESDPSRWMRPVEGRINTFMTVNTGRPADVELKPFYTVYDRRYSVSWDLYTEAGWKAKQAEFEAEAERLKKISDATVDFVQPGDLHGERNHNFKGERSLPGRISRRQDLRYLRF